MTSPQNYVVATVKPWNLTAFERKRSSLPGQWHLIGNERDLTLARLDMLSPRYVFLPHWSWRVPAEIVKKYECVCFHMADVPYGRGGSPLQNLIIRGHADTKLTALRMTDEIDAGPVYMKRLLSLAGSAQQIFERAADLAFTMIDEIVRANPEPKPQSGPVTLFRRRTPGQSELPREASLQSIYDFIRMLDAETYPRAFLDHGKYRLSFSDAHLSEGGLTAKVSVSERSERDV
jgi:methionyl-tRNA formyltransferase